MSSLNRACILPYCWHNWCFYRYLSGIFAEYGADGLQFVAPMAGIILCFLGFARMMSVIRYIPVPVIRGFMAEIGIVSGLDHLGLVGSTGAPFS